MGIEFRTPVIIDQGPFSFSYQDKVLLMGSCFAENMGNRLKSNKFSVDVNPFGTLYNPFSIERSLRMLMHPVSFTSSNLIEQDGLFHSFSHHSRFSSTTEEGTLTAINNRLHRAAQSLGEGTRLIITFGTAYVYCLKSTGEVVANCHKLPEKRFERKLLSVAEIVVRWSKLLAELGKQQPNLKILFTVSPIRHGKEGLHGNQLSKATLLLAIHELAHLYPDRVSYFPAYELLMDELRDYRFYADDMLHPSPLAIDYIWERFAEVYFSKQTRLIWQEWQDINKAIGHKAFQPNSEKHQRFIIQTLLKAEQFSEKFPTFDISQEMALLKSKLT